MAFPISVDGLLHFSFVVNFKFCKGQLWAGEGNANMSSDWRSGKL